MKITHICLAGVVTDNWNYQENILSKYHKKLGHEVSLVTSRFIWNKVGELELTTKKKYFNVDGVKVIRLKLKGKSDFNKKIKKYNDVLKTLEYLQPEVLFIHGCQFIDVKQIVKYAKKNPELIIYVDNHADYSNSATNWISKNILHKIIWKRMAKKIEPFTKKFYGVLPARVDFLTDVYMIPEEKVELLFLGADDEKVEEAKNPNTRESIRKKYGIEKDDFLIMTGGKIDNAKKQTLMLMQAVKNIPEKKVKLIVFGSVIPELKAEIDKLVDGIKIQYIGWIESEESYKYFASAELVVFPGRHSVFWEQVIALGIPMIVKRWEGTNHINIGGNVKYLNKDSVKEIEECVLKLINNKSEYNNILQKANAKEKNKFLYSKIAEKSLL